MGRQSIQEKTSTAVVYPRQEAEVDEFLNLNIQLERFKINDTFTVQLDVDLLQSASLVRPLAIQTSRQEV